MAEPVKLEDLKTCPKCGESNRKEERHCSHCGASLANVVPGPAQVEKKRAKLMERLRKKA